MKILFVHTLYSPDVVGGAEIVLQSLAEGIKARGIDVAILTTTDKPGLHRGEVNGIRVWRAGLHNLYWHKYSERPGALKRRLWHAMDTYNPLMAKMVKQVVSLERPTVASVHNLPGFSVSAWTALRASGVPIVQVLHDHYLLCPASTMYKHGQNCETQCSICKIMRLPHKAMSQNISGVIGVSKYILNRHLDAGYFNGVKNRKVIYNTRTAQEIGLLATREVTLDRNRPLRFGFIGTLSPVKGIEALLQTFSENTFPGSELWVAGTGETGYTDKLKCMASGHPVRFLGRVNPVEFYSQVDIVIVPSLWNEPLGTVILEAMIYGKPIIASNTGGTAEMITHGNNGLLFNQDDPRGLLDMMTQISSNLSLRKRLADGSDSQRIRFMNREYFLDEHILSYLGAEYHG